MGFDHIDRQFKAKPSTKILLECLNCESPEGVEMESSRTCYHYDGEPGSDDDPNKSIPLCRPCAIKHHEYWDDMWHEYYRGRL
jgi:hypothetical protein